MEERSYIGQSPSALQASPPIGGEPTGWHSLPIKGEGWEGGPFILVRTSGSTGTPKEMLVEKRRMLASARITCDFLGLKPGDTALLCLSTDYIAGKMMVMRSIERGLRLISVPPSNHPLEGLTSAPDFAAMVPSQVYSSLGNPLLRKIRHLIIGGGAISAALEQALRTFPYAVWSTYGMTETLSHIALRRLSGSEASEWYTPFEGVKLSQDADGCLIIDAPAVCSETLTTNDIAIFHPEDKGKDSPRFRILGRRDNIVCSGGIKIQIEEVERLLQPHLSSPFAISSIPDPKFGEALVLVVEKTSGISQQEYSTICKQHLPPYHVPRHIIYTDKIPQTETGKIARARLKQKIVGG